MQNEAIYRHAGPIEMFTRVQGNWEAIREAENDNETRRSSSIQQYIHSYEFIERHVRS
jgi:hypothetical protein